MSNFKVYKLVDGRDVVISDLAAWRSGCRSLRDINGSNKNSNTSDVKEVKDFNEFSHLLKNPKSFSKKELERVDLNSIITNAVKSALSSAK